MDATVVHFDVMVGWGLAAGVQWLLLEPLVLSLFASLTLFLKWCTSFEDYEVPAVEKTEAQIMKEAIKGASDGGQLPVLKDPTSGDLYHMTPVKALTFKKSGKAEIASPTSKRGSDTPQ